MKLSKIYILLGPPGSGKGTQADMLAEKFGYLHFGVGEMLREYIKDHPENQEVKDRYDHGTPQPDEFILELFNRRFKEISEHETGIIFDAFPLSIGQAKFLDQLLKDFKVAVRVFYIDLPDEEVLKRLALRKICTGCKNPSLPEQETYSAPQCYLCGGHMIVRTDDKPEVVKNRIEEYERRTGPIKDFYNEQKSLVIVNGNQTVFEVHNEIINDLK